MSGPSSSLSSPSSSEKHTKDVVSQSQWNELNHSMTRMIQPLWQFTPVNSESDLRALIGTVLRILVIGLARMDLKDKIVTPETATTMTESINEDELEKWNVAIQNCMEKNDWVDLLRTCVSDYRTVGLRSTVTTAQVTMPTSPDAASTYLPKTYPGTHSK